MSSGEAGHIAPGDILIPNRRRLSNRFHAIIYNRSSLERSVWLTL